MLGPPPALQDKSHFYFTRSPNGRRSKSIVSELFQCQHRTKSLRWVSRRRNQWVPIIYCSSGRLGGGCELTAAWSPAVWVVYLPRGPWLSKWFAACPPACRLAFPLTCALQSWKCIVCSAILHIFVFVWFTLCHIFVVDVDINNSTDTLTVLVFQVIIN